MRDGARRAGWRLGLVVALVLPLTAVPGLVTAAEHAAAGTAARTVVRLDDPRLTESSGIAAVGAGADTVFVINDSGADATVFAVDTATGRTRAVVRVTGAQASDWEDIAVAPDDAGRPSLWIADTGANTATRTELRLYRVLIPRLPDYTGPSRSAPVVPTAPAALWRLSYAGGVVDTEALAVDPQNHRAYLTTKSALGRSTVYRVPVEPDPTRVQVADVVARLSFRTTGTPGGPVPPIGQVTVTGAAISATGSLFVLRTYTDAYLWPVQAGDVAAALQSDPVHVALPAQPQGEGVTVVGAELWLSSEGVGQPILAVAIPAGVIGASAGPSAVSPAPVPSAAPSSSAPADGSDSNETTAWGLGVIIAVVALVWFLSRRLRRKDEKVPEDHSWMG